MNALQWIVREAKKIKRKHPRRFAHWKEYVAEASAIYARKHKGKSPVGKKRHVANVVTRSRTHVDKNRLTTNIQIGGANKIEAANQVLQLTKDIQNTDRQIEIVNTTLRNMRRDPKGYGRNTAPYTKQLRYLKGLRAAQKKSISHYKRLL